MPPSEAGGPSTSSDADKNMNTDQLLEIQPETPLFPALGHKRSAALLDDGEEDREIGPSRKRMKESADGVRSADYDTSGAKTIAQINHDVFLEDLAQELQCGCCSGLVHKPVVVNPCQHFFCGSCCVLWTRNGGSNCPACRGISSSVTPSRPLQSIVDVLLRSYPSLARSESERKQADDVYTSGSLRLLQPREASPEVNLNQNDEFARPCPHCVSGNPYDWRCPQPIADPQTDPEHAWNLEEGAPPGHGYCGNCENLVALQAPETTKCDMCRVSFCRIGVPGRCVALPLLAQSPHGFSDTMDLIQSSEVYDCFESNTIEVEYMLDYLGSRRITPTQIYKDIVSHIQDQPRRFAPLIEFDLFADHHGYATSSNDVPPEAPRHLICRICAAEVFLWGLKDWWIRERQQGFLSDDIKNRPDCIRGSACERQKDQFHARQFNHIIAPSTATETNHAESSHSEIARPVLPEHDDVGFRFAPLPPTTTRPYPSVIPAHVAMDAPSTLPPLTGIPSTSGGSALPTLLGHDFSLSHDLVNDVLDAYL